MRRPDAGPERVNYSLRRDLSRISVCPALHPVFLCSLPKKGVVRLRNSYTIFSFKMYRMSVFFTSTYVHIEPEEVRHPPPSCGPSWHDGKQRLDNGRRHTNESSNHGQVCRCTH